MPVQTKKTRVALIFITLLISCGMGSGTSATYALPNSREYSIKAAFLLNFGKFIEWPSHAFPDATSSLTLCILGNDPFGAALETIEGKIVRERKLVIKRCSRVEDINGCQILFISSSEKNNLSEILLKTKKLPILTVGDMKNFCQSNGIINFTTGKQKVHLEINTDASQCAGLKISSKLLMLSRIVRER